MAEKKTNTDAEDVELELKKLQIETMRQDLQDRADRRTRVERNRAQQLLDYQKGEAARLRRQAICKHRKGGKNNNFANGNDANYSVITNTYPLGEICIMCTRCGKEVWKPDAKLKKSDPEKYAAMLAEFKQWAQFPTDNTPSGGKIFEITAA